MFAYPTSQHGSIAQLGERLPYKQDVIGSSPIVPINKNTAKPSISGVFVCL